LDNGGYEPFIISLEEFSQKHRIEFFDTVLDYYSSHKEWRVVQVTEISIRQEEKNDSLIMLDDEVEGDEYFEEAAESDLLSITQAVLQGQSLRTNSFVKNARIKVFIFLL
jgi:hypothetical protein